MGFNMAKKMKLLGCPFCGSKAYWVIGNAETKTNDLVQCQNCWAEIEGTHEPMSALAAWNYRTASHFVHKNDRDVTIEGENL